MVIYFVVYILIKDTVGVFDRASLIMGNIYSRIYITGGKSLKMVRLLIGYV